MPAEMIACCGLVCSQCPAFLATQAGDEEKARQTAELWSRQYKVEVRVENVWCDGCMAPGRKCGHCGECEIRACALQRGVATCAACDDYGCETIGRFLAMVPPAKETLERLRAGR